jgi:hypothetical protein
LINSPAGGYYKGIGMMIIILYQLSQILDQSMPLLGDYRGCYNDLKYTQPLYILIAERLIPQSHHAKISKHQYIDDTHLLMGL